MLLFAVLASVVNAADVNEKDSIPYDFYELNADNDTIWYKITSREDMTCEVTFRKYKGEYVDYSDTLRYSGNIVIPAIVLHNDTIYTVTGIGNDAFMCCFYLENIELPNTIKYIGFEGINYCDSLKSIKLPESLEELGRYALGNNEGLISVTIPASVKKIGAGAFFYCSNLETIEVDDANDYYTDEDGVLYTKDMGTLVCYPANKSGDSYAINEKCKKIEEQAFCDCKDLKDIVLPEGLDSIMSWAFAWCNSMESINIPASVRCITNGSVFYFCESLSTITVDKENPYYMVEDNVLFDSDKTTLVSFVPNNSLTTYSIPESVDSIVFEAFFYPQNLKKVVIPTSVNYIGNYAFYSNSEISNLIDTIVCKFSTPIERVDSVTFGYEMYEKTILVVPDGSKVKYQENYPWSLFKNVMTESEVTGINEINADNTPASVTTDDRIYDLQGRRLDTVPGDGILYIKDGRKYFGN